MYVQLHKTYGLKGEKLMLSKKLYVEKTKEEAINKCLEELGLKEEQLYIVESEIESGKLFKTKKSQVEVVTKEDVKNFIREYIKMISKLMNINIQSEININDTIINVLLISDNNSILIGKEGRTLNSIQILLRQSISNQTGLNLKVMVDVSNYKAKKMKYFEKEVKNICREVLNNHIDVKLDPMNSYKRRIVHNIANKYDNLITKSEGIEPTRYVIVKYKEN